jgi:putative membrane protein
MKQHTYLFLFVTIALSIIQLVGIVGMLFLGDWFKYITSIHLLVSLSYLLYFHRPINIGLIKALVFLFILGYIIEFIGIHTQWPFGSYQYLYALGPKLFEVPVIIGVNWILLSYSSLQVAKLFHSIGHPRWLLYIKAGLIMVTMDVLIEPLCNLLGFWVWEYSFAPIQNYIAWYVFGSFYCWIIDKYSENQIQLQGIVLYVLQLLFFLTLFVFHFIL